MKNVFATWDGEPLQTLSEETATAFITDACIEDCYKEDDAGIIAKDFVIDETEHYWDDLPADIRQHLTELFSKCFKSYLANHKE